MHELAIYYGRKLISIISSSDNSDHLNEYLRAGSGTEKDNQALYCHTRFMNWGKKRPTGNNADMAAISRIVVPSKLLTNLHTPPYSRYDHKQQQNQENNKHGDTSRKGKKAPLTPPWDASWDQENTNNTPLHKQEHEHELLYIHTLRSENPPIFPN